MRYLAALCLCTFAVVSPAFADCANPDIVNDDGTLENGYTHAVNSGAFVMLFQPPNVGAVYRELCISLAQNNGGTDTELPFSVVVYNNVNGQPGTVVTSKSATATNVPAYPAFSTYTVNLLSLSLPGKAYFIGIQWNATTNDGFLIGADESAGTTLAPGFYSANGGGSWDPIASTFLNYKALGLRVTSQQQAYELCDANSAFAQRSPVLVEPMDGDESDGGEYLADNYSGVFAPITKVSWWAGGANFISVPCEPDSKTWTVTFYVDNGGQPDTVVSSQLVTPTITPTGREYGTRDFDEYEFTATLPEPVSLSNGWVSVRADAGVLCYHYWLNSPEGDKLSYKWNMTSWVPLARDRALCLTTACPSQLQAGSRVQLLIDDPDGNASLKKGNLGTVVCESVDPVYRWLVEWDNFTNGHDGNVGLNPCGTTSNPTSGWYMRSENITAACEGAFLSLDGDQNGSLGFQELLRAIQFYNSEQYHCDAGSEDGFAPGAGDQTCDPMNSDYDGQAWALSLSELLRLIQLYSSGSYQVCPSGGTDDGFCAAD